MTEACGKCYVILRIRLDVNQGFEQLEYSSMKKRFICADDDLFSFHLQLVKMIVEWGGLNTTNFLIEIFFCHNGYITIFKSYHFFFVSLNRFFMQNNKDKIRD